MAKPGPDGAKTSPPICALAINAEKDSMKKSTPKIVQDWIFKPIWNYFEINKQSLGGKQLAQPCE